MATLGATVRSLRSRAGLSQGDLAELVGMSQGQISRLERGRWERIRPEFLVQLATVLGVSPAALLPETAPWPVAELGRADVFRVGCWESVWAAPVMSLAGAPPTATRVSTRVPVEGSSFGSRPQLQGTLPSRPLTPSELVRALRSSYFVAIVVPREATFEDPSDLMECAQLAIAVDGLHIAVALPEEDLLPSAVDFRTTAEHPAPWEGVVWDRVRTAAARSPVPIYLPTDVAAIDLVHRLRHVLHGRVTPRTISLEEWPSFLVDTNDIVMWGRGPVVAVAPEPHLHAWRRAVQAAGTGLTTVLVRSPEIWADPLPTISVLSLIFHRERCDPWVTSPLVYDFLDAVQRQAQEISRRSPRLLALIAERLQLDVPTILQELSRCDFTTRFAPSWVAQLRGHSRAIAV
jgi:DNA-binding Xre family transcriptional regulator